MPPSLTNSDFSSDMVETVINARWVSEPNFRGTSKILSSCLSTIFICVWNAYHPDFSYAILDWRVTKGTQHIPLSFGYFFYYLFAPEALFANALLELRLALILYHNLNRGDLFPPVHRPWCLRWVWKRALLEKPQALASRRHPWTLTHSYYAVMGGYAVRTFKYGHEPKGVSESYRNLCACEVQELFRVMPECIPDISEEDILTRSQTDALSKGIALLQIFSFCSTCILRVAQGLSLSILEISTVCYAICATMAYIIWWKKPRFKAGPTIIVLDPGKDLSLSHMHMHAEGTPESMDDKPVHLSYEKWLVASFTIANFSPLIYVFLHFPTWNHSFPTYTEQIAWRISLILIALSCIPLWLSNTILERVPKFTARRNAKQERLVLNAVLGLLYVPARLFMIVEAFRELLYLPPDAYQVASWSKYLPQFS